MDISVTELAAFIGGQLVSGVDGSARVTGVAALEDAGAHDVTFFNNPKYLQKLRASHAAAVLVPLDFAEDVPPICIRCENPTVSFTKVIERLTPPPVKFAPGIHPTAVLGHEVKLGADVSIQPYAVIENGAQIGDRTVIGAHCYIGHHVRIGEGSTLGPRVMIGTRCIVGNRVILHTGVVLGTDGFGYDFKDGRYVKVPQVGIVQIDDDVEIGANSCIDRARFGRTWVQEGCKIDNLVQVGHNVVIGKHSIVCGLVGIAGSVTLGKYVTLAGQAGVSGHLEIGDQAIVSAGSGVTKSIAPNKLVMGYPAADAKEWREQVAHLRSLGKLKARVRALEQRLGETGKSLPPEP